MLHLPHHDGSAVHVPARAPTLGERVPVYVRIPHTFPVEAVHVRALRDGEPAWTVAEPERADRHDVWWRADVQVANPLTPYRFLLDQGPAGYAWLNGTGVHRREVSDASDFRLTTATLPPGWTADAVLYQVFCDRFARSSRAPDQVPSWAVPAAWSEPVVERGPHTPLQFYGGDLWGIAERLDHVEKLGADVVYLTPFFAAESNHRYNASTFDHVDPLLGGDAALRHLVETAHGRGLRVLGDLTTNHSGNTHVWFRRAQADPASPEARYYAFRDHPDDYESWLGEPTLPRFDLTSAELRGRLVDGPDSVVGRWLRPPFDLDGWRIDVANMTGRIGEVDLNHTVARTIRSTMHALKPDAYLVAEHFHDASADLAAGGWHGVMNYAGFMRPLWSWLAAPGTTLRFPGMPVALPGFGGAETAATMREIMAAAPWSATAHSVTLLGSHDTPRVRTVLGSPERVAVAAGLLIAYPGVPMVFMGDELGLEGVDGEDARQPMPWDQPGRVHGPTAELFRDLLRLRRDHPALRHGGLRWVHASTEALAFLREDRDERLLVLAVRAGRCAIDLPGSIASARPQALHGPGTAEIAAGMLRLRAEGPSCTLWGL